MIWLVAAALAGPLPACPEPPAESSFTLGIHAAGHSFGGLAVLTWDAAPGDFTLVALSPAGPPIFVATRAAGATTVDAPAFPQMAGPLAQLPLGRDLRLLTTPAESSCTVDGGRVLVDGDVRRWRGPGGPARATRSADGRWQLRDVWRGYRLQYAPVSP